MTKDLELVKKHIEKELQKIDPTKNDYSFGKTMAYESLLSYIDGINSYYKEVEK